MAGFGLLVATPFEGSALPDSFDLEIAPFRGDFAGSGDTAMANQSRA